MNDGSRFASLKHYKSIDYFKKHPVIEFNTLYEKHKWKIAAVIITNGHVKGDNGYFFDFTFNVLCIGEFYTPFSIDGGAA